MDFTTRYKKLNAAQKQAVDHIDGPLMVIAGPGTGKTELLSMRVANILRRTDTLPESILCLTFTDSGAEAMRARLREIVGEPAYKVAIHTFHSFGAEVINQYGEYFFYGARFEPADELAVHSIITSLLDELPYSHPLASKMNGEYTHISDLARTFSEFKRSGLASSELVAILDDNDRTMDSLEPDARDVLGARISASTLARLIPFAHTVAELPHQPLPGDIRPLSSVLALSLAHAVDQAQDDDSTKPITAWKNTWFEKNDRGELVFKDRKRQVKLRAAIGLYDMYLGRLQTAELFDFDDMILQVAHALETNPDLRYNLQERYQYLMVDEFQDTNMAQARVLHNLTSSEAHEGRPNLMVVGDDDQAIYAFQGAEVSNILGFRDTYRDVAQVTLTDNYRSSPQILTAARGLITQGAERLERYIPELDKTLTPHSTAASPVTLLAAETPHDQYQAVVDDIAARIADGAQPSSIAVLARHHRTIGELLPYTTTAAIPVSYDRQDNVLLSPVITLLTKCTRVLVLLGEQRLDDANSLLPELLAHPMWQLNSQTLWKLSITAHSERKQWLHVMSQTPELQPLAQWFIQTSQRIVDLPLERAIDLVVGYQQDAEFVSPLYRYHFSASLQGSDPRTYLEYLEALRAIRDTLRLHTGASTLAAWLEIVDLYRDTDTPIMSRSTYRSSDDAVQLMTAHKSKGLEFDHVYVVDAVDSLWGHTARSRGRMISYPANLPLAPSGASYDERLRLFYVAMTRARQQLTISYAAHGQNDKATSPAGFLTPLELKESSVQASSSNSQAVASAELAWYAPIVAPVSPSMEALLSPLMQRYKLSATHLGNFLDVTRGGPQHFLLSSLLRFPGAMAPAAVYGSAIHAVLQRAHNHVRAHGSHRPVEDIISEFEQLLDDSRLTPEEKEQFQERGASALTAFLAAKYDSFTDSQRVELSFAGQNVHVGDAHLTGALDLVDIDEKLKTLYVTDYKTGKPPLSWQGTTDYEKIKLHKYKQQLMFYKLLVEHSRDYSKYTVPTGTLQMVEPTRSGDIITLEHEFTADELEQFKTLITAVWQHITTLDFPDTSHYEQSYKGILAFERDLVEGIDQ